MTEDSIQNVLKKQQLFILQGVAKTLTEIMPCDPIAKSTDPDQAPQNAASDQVIHCLH